MSNVALKGDRRMTVAEVSGILNRDESTIRKIGKALYPDAFSNGVKTYLTEAQVTAIKMNLGKNSELPKTELEKELVILQAMQFQQERILSMQTQLESQAPKVEAYEALMKTDTHMSITQAAKHFNLHPKLQVFPYLRTKGYLTKADMPTQKALDLDILTLRQNENKEHGKTYPQAVVEANQLDNFRRVVALKILENPEGITNE